MSKLYPIIKREFWYNLKRPSFVFAMFGFPLMIIAIFALTIVLIGNEDAPLENVLQVGFVDSVGFLPDEAVLDDNSGVRFVPFEDTQSARQAYDAGEIQLYLELPASYMNDGRVNLFSESPPAENLKARLNEWVYAQLSLTSSTDFPLARVDAPMEDTLISAIETGRTVTESGIFGLVIMPLLFSLFLVMGSITTSSFLMSGLVEEKENRVIEILVTSTSPLQLLAGKVIGLGMLGVLQLLVLLTVIYGGLALSQNVELLNGISIPPDMAIMAMIYYLCAYGLSASLLSGLGVVVGGEQESKQISGLIVLPFMIPYLFMFTFFTDPNSTTAIVLSMLPFTAPMAMLMRMGFTAVPFEQLVISVGIQLVALLLAVWLASRVFRWAVLRYDLKFSPMRLIRRAMRRPAPNTHQAITE